MTMKPVIFIDGREGTTGLQIYDRLTPRQDIELLLIDEEKRKDPAERKKCLNAEVKQRHKRDFPHAREVALHGAVGKRAKQKGHEHRRTGRQKVGHKEQRNR